MPEPSKVRQTILIVDDDPGVREALRLILEPRYQALEAPGGDSALAQVESSRVDLILLDLLMEGADGIWFLEHLRGRGYDIPVIVVSGLTNAWTASATMRLGVTDYVTKPFEEEELLGTVDAALGGVTAASQLRSGDRRARILLVGCSVDFAAALAAAFVEQTNVESVPAGDHAYRSLPSPRRPDAIVVDLASDVPEPSELLLKIRTRFPLAAVVAINLSERRAAALHESAVGGVAIVPKPAGVRELLERLAREMCAGPAALPQLSPKVIKIMEFVATNLATATLLDIGGALRASPYYLSRLFREQTGLPLRVYLNRARVAAARQLLLETTDKLEDIATRVGFHDGSHLSRHFFRFLGVRPGELRRKWREAPGRAPAAASLGHLSP